VTALSFILQYHCSVFTPAMRFLDSNHICSQSSVVLLS